MNWQGAQPPSEPDHPQPETDERSHDGVPTSGAVAEEWERAVSEAMNTVRQALDLAHDRMQSLTNENRTLQARLYRVAAALNDPLEGRG